MKTPMLYSYFLDLHICPPEIAGRPGQSGFSYLPFIRSLDRGCFTKAGWRWCSRLIAPKGIAGYVYKVIVPCKESNYNYLQKYLRLAAKKSLPAAGNFICFTVKVSEDMQNFKLFPTFTVRIYFSASASPLTGQSALMHKNVHALRAFFSMVAHRLCAWTFNIALHRRGCGCPP